MEFKTKIKVVFLGQVFLSYRIDYSVWKISEEQIRMK